MVYYTHHPTWLTNLVSGLVCTWGIASRAREESLRWLDKKLPANSADAHHAQNTKTAHRFFIQEDQEDKTGVAWGVTGAIIIVAEVYFCQFLTITWGLQSGHLDLFLHWGGFSGLFGGPMVSSVQKDELNLPFRAHSDFALTWKQIYNLRYLAFFQFIS